MLELARQRLAHVSTRVNDLPPLESADLAERVEIKPQVVSAVLSHHYCCPEARRAAVQACHDILAAGGVFITVECIALRTEMGTQIGLQRWKWAQMRMGRAEDVVDAHLARLGTKVLPITVEAHIQLLSDVGFQTVEVFWLNHMQAGLYGIKRT